MNIMALPRYGRLGASSRLRTYQYIPMLESEGIKISVNEILRDAHLESFYAGKGRRSVRAIVGGYVNRIFSLLSSSKYDALWVEKEALPWVPYLIESSLLPRGVPLIVDYDDAVFHRYDQHGRRIVRNILGGKLDRLMKRADLVVAGNSYLADRAWKAGSSRVEIVPTAVDLDRYPVARKSSGRSGKVVVGWIGSPFTARYLSMISGALSALKNDHDIECVAIGARKDQVDGTPFLAIPWSESGEVDSLRSLDIGIMPLPDEPFERGKCGYKIIQYMACGLPVVASPVGVNKDIICHEWNGYLADGVDEWVVFLERLISDASLRSAMGRRGREIVEDVYCTRVQGKRIVEIMRGLKK